MAVYDPVWRTKTLDMNYEEAHEQLRAEFIRLGREQDFQFLDSVMQIVGEAWENAEGTAVEGFLHLVIHYLAETQEFWGDEARACADTH